MKRKIKIDLFMKSGRTLSFRIDKEEADRGFFSTLLSPPHGKQQIHLRGVVIYKHELEGYRLKNYPEKNYSFPEEES